MNIVWPKEYEARHNVTSKQIIDVGFLDKGDHFRISKKLFVNQQFKNSITLTVYINKDDNYMTTKVIDSSNNYYIPFYNPDWRHHNSVYETVVKEHNKFMDGLVKKGILIEIPKVTSNDGETIYIKYFSGDIEKIKKIENGDWIDLRAAETVFMNVGEFALIPLGIGMILPQGYEAHVIPRSSTYKNFGIIQTNHMGLIDESYSGDNDQWFFPAYALRDTVINKNDRICQFRIMKKQPAINFVEVAKLKDNDRGGFGSTGKK